MSHFTVLVIGDDVERQLQPYHEYECTGIKDEYVKFTPTERTMEELQKTYEENKEKYNYESFEQFMKDYYGYNEENGVWGRVTNPNAKWDWWVIGGRWTGFLKKKEGTNGVLGRPGVFNNEPTENGADIIRKGDVDWEGMRNDVVEESSKRYDLVHEGIKDTPEHESWESVRNRIEDIGEARKFYHSQERIVAFNKVCDDNKDLFGWFNSIEDYLYDKDTYIERKKNESITTYAIVKDGQWYQRGEMGWFGISSNDMDQDEWNKKYWELIQSVPDDVILTLVDCHI
jgi:hypothetical protein